MFELPDLPPGATYEINEDIVAGQKQVIPLPSRIQQKSA